MFLVGQGVNPYEKIKWFGTAHAKAFQEIDGRGQKRT
jgi:hypothetical protein